ncbi:GtrA family protein [Shewanella sp. VB17]|uniref:GtrA family protein n=1 Tax=Shewanella sp. VB17 TaxID=2739432 RepID=UPI0020B85CB1|nr:GtrA family protein [Shewanella sp. VB17]
MTQLKYLMVGGASFIVDVLIFILMYQYLGFPIVEARLVAFGAALTLTWLGNRLFTFSYRQQLPKRKQFITVLILACIAGLINLSVFYLLSEWSPPTALTSPIYLALGVLSGLVINWVGANYLVFRNV